MHIFTPTDQAQGDHAVYDIDQAVLVMTGHDLKLTTPNDVLTARDDLEYWPQKHMAVARGNAVVVTKDGRRIAADTLVAYTTPTQRRRPAGGATHGRRRRRRRRADAGEAAGDDPLAASGKLEKVEAFGHVSVRTADRHRDRRPRRLCARHRHRPLVGNVRITRGENQLERAGGRGEHEDRHRPPAVAARRRGCRAWSCRTTPTSQAPQPAPPPAGRRPSRRRPANP